MGDQVIGGQVSELLVDPIALAEAARVRVDAMEVAVAVGASVAFTPDAHPVNAMVMGPGGYRSAHFVRVGAGRTVVTLLGLVLAMWLLWRITPGSSEEEHGERDPTPPSGGPALGPPGPGTYVHRRAFPYGCCSGAAHVAQEH